MDTVIGPYGVPMCVHTISVHEEHCDDCMAPIDVCDDCRCIVQCCPCGTCHAVECDERHP